MPETSVQQIISQLTHAFTVKDIMVPVSDLVRGYDSHEAQDLLDMYPQYDVIPMPREGTINSYLHRSSAKPRYITSTDLISDGTPLIDLPDLFLKRDFFLVLSSNNIAGFVHFSDLNNSIIKLPFFALFESIERKLWDSIKDMITEQDVALIINNQERLRTVLQKHEQAKDKDVDLGWSGIFYFDEIIRLSNYYGSHQINDNERTTLTDIRNRVAHTGKLLVKKHSETRKLVQVRDLSYRIASL
jgi:hypothetical protein